ncbi:MAG: hypothetical protein A2087_12395 [Spirochaetes bacterium GWD1_61_31]|nr:MAG: hypothetical protein A2Y37_06330 [Spirochaetes bacterium GWB1_60_80]OHD33596.1 MAG: hypothetical protein A2004_06485 [Spirochaetes bacterium GWC1_61_12]OHD38519.1 MAG: hypothetical protein A2087_12395 [Spirochaetes bacterium GWD1_61_31]OHD43037.1 MAG: hypothetical protein A2Y35_01280 [Spirochaetes bacterium GWE1_60_18]OHD59632.1 MAG: hypothetical protein A2Y32_12160 [Spirochaetes bacterium GWF1_60_12]
MAPTARKRLASSTASLALRPVAQQDIYLDTLAGRQIEAALHGRAGLQAGFHGTGPPQSAQGGRLGQLAVAADKLGLVGRQRPDRATHVQENHPSGKFGIIPVAREECAGLS